MSALIVRSEPLTTIRGHAFDAGRSVLWTGDAPRSIARAGDYSDGSKGWRAWQKYLKKRKQSLRDWLPRGGCPLAWGLDAEKADRLLPSRLSARELAESAHSWLDEAGTTAATPEWALVSVAWAYEMPWLAAQLSADSWWQMLAALVQIARDSQAASIDEPWTHLLLASELPLALSFALPEIAACQELGEAGRSAVVEAAPTWIGENDELRFDPFDRLRPIVASLVRSHATCEATGQKRWSRPARERFTALVEHMLRLSRPDGSGCFTPAAGADEAKLLEAAANATGKRKLEKTVELITGDRSRCRSKLASPAAHGEVARWGVLRSAWSSASPRLAVSYRTPTVEAELGIGRDVLFSGPCPIEVRIDGEALQPAANWEEVCWQTDEDVDYIELEMNWPGMLRVQRQMLLARADQFLLWADALLPERRCDIEYRSWLPLADEVRFETAVETREGILSGKKPRAWVLPLALPEWRSDRRGGSLEVTEGRLCLRHQARASRGLFAPLFMDLDRDRFSRPMTWRPLTVAENRQNQARDVAVGYRVQIGVEQWLVYRSLTPGTGRTLLGHHLLTQFLVGRFSMAGEVRSLLEIE